MWLSTDSVDPGSGFTAYAVLGYDIVIGNAEVAAMYQKVVAISDDSDFKSSDSKLEIKSNHLRFRFRMKDAWCTFRQFDGSGAKGFHL